MRGFLFLTNTHSEESKICKISSKVAKIQFSASGFSLVTITQHNNFSHGGQDSRSFGI